jgi:hypothetical protein
MSWETILIITGMVCGLMWALNRRKNRPLMPPSTPHNGLTLHTSHPYVCSTAAALDRLSSTILLLEMNGMAATLRMAYGKSTMPLAFLLSRVFK